MIFLIKPISKYQFKLTVSFLSYYTGIEIVCEYGDVLSALICQIDCTHKK